MKWVVKFGGSQYANPRLAKAMRHTSRFAPRPLIVPGGGVFADQVRKAQKRWGFDDATAHRMALLAMREYGLLLAALGDLPIIDGEIRFGEGVWLPDEHSDFGIADWHYTSDSVAAWLARQLRVNYLILIKPVGVRAPAVNTVADKHFMSVIRDSATRVIVLDIEDWLNLTTVDNLPALCEQT